VYSLTTGANQCTFECQSGTVYNSDVHKCISVLQYDGCDTPNIVVGNYILAACNVGATTAGTTASSYGYHFQRGNNYGFNAQPGSTVVSGALEQLVDATGY
jgi:hypothetical protein